MHTLKNYLLKMLVKLICFIVLTVHFVAIAEHLCQTQQFYNIIAAVISSSLRKFCTQNLQQRSIVPEIICLSETKLGKKIDDTEVNFPDYCVHRADRIRRGGGIAIYFSDNLEVTPLDLVSTPWSLLECAAVKIMFHLKSFLLVCFIDHHIVRQSGSTITMTVLTTFNRLICH